MNKTAKSMTSSKSKWTQQDAANKTYPRLKKRHKKQKIAELTMSPDAFHRINTLIAEPPTPSTRLRTAAATFKKKATP